LIFRDRETELRKMLSERSLRSWSGKKWEGIKKILSKEACAAPLAKN